MLTLGPLKEMLLLTLYCCERLNSCLHQQFWPYSHPKQLEDGGFFNSPPMFLHHTLSSCEMWPRCSQLTLWLRSHSFAMTPYCNTHSCSALTPRTINIHANMCPILLISIPALSCWHMLHIQQQQQLCLSHYGAKLTPIPSFGHAPVPEKRLSTQPGPPPSLQASSLRTRTGILTWPVCSLITP